MVTKTQEITNREDVINSRDIITRIAYLEIGNDGDCADCANDECVDDEHAELIKLKAFAEEGEQAEDWLYGAQFIRDSHFEDYARQLAADVCDMKSADQWPFTCIDWAEAANVLQTDYFSVDFDGETYWTR